MLREYFQSRKTRRLFRKYLDEDAVESLMAGRLDPFQLKQGPIQVVLVAVRGDTPESISQRMGAVADIALEHGAVVDCMVSSIVVLAFGMGPQTGQLVGDRFTLTTEIMRQMSGNAKVVHCERHGVYGNLGSNRRLTYGFVVPGFIEMLGKLSSVQFGGSTEFEQRDA